MRRPLFSFPVGALKNFHSEILKKFRRSRAVPIKYICVEKWQVPGKRFNLVERKRVEFVAKINAGLYDLVAGFSGGVYFLCRSLQQSSDRARERVCVVPLVSRTSAFSALCGASSAPKPGSVCASGPTRARRRTGLE